LIHDAQYHWAEYTGAKGSCKKGWGHSTWTEAVAVAQRCGARRLALFHHDPTRDDAGVRDIEALAQERFPMAVAAREGWSVTL
jgi:ribonuclease BN (tRNA processing enzyme)